MRSYWYSLQQKVTLGTRQEFSGKQAISNYNLSPRENRKMLLYLSGEIIRHVPHDYTSVHLIFYFYHENQRNAFFFYPKSEILCFEHEMIIQIHGLQKTIKIHPHISDGFSDVHFQVNLNQFSHSSSHTQEENQQNPRK